MSREPVIICVDDEKVVLNGLQSQLGREFSDTHLVEVAESGEEALELFEELQTEGHEIQVFITDELMPGLKGHEVLQKVFSISPRTFTILLTGQSDISAITEAVNNANLYRYITKPWEGTDLILTIREAIRSYEKDSILEEQNRMLKEYNEQLEARVAERTKDLEEEKQKLEQVNKDLRETREELIRQERLATLGEVSMEIAHEIQNPLNFVNNFAEINDELIEQTLSELEKELSKDEFKSVLETLKQNSESIANHGKRAAWMITEFLTSVRKIRAGQGGAIDN